MFYLLIGFIVHLCRISQAQNSPLSCFACLGLAKNECLVTQGCFWSDRISTCGNACEYAIEDECCIEDALGNPISGCCNICRYLPGGLNACIIRWDFHFDICFVVDASESITLMEWQSIKEFFIVQYINAITPDACDLTKPDISGFCPHVGVVQYDSIAQTIIPNLAADQPYYNETSSCFRNDTYLHHLHLDWTTTIAGMLRSQDQSRPAGGNTWTVLGVQRCADLLVNTYNRQQKTLSLLVVMTDGSPNGPSRCQGDVCDICGVNPEKQDFQLPKTDFLHRYDASCDPAVAGQVIPPETRQLDKLLAINARRILVLFKPEVDAFKNDIMLLCMIAGQPGSFASAFQVPTPLLQNVSDPALQAAVGIIIKNLSDTVCEFSVAPTMSPTKLPTVTPSKPPTKIPSASPTDTPSKNPTTTPTKPPTRTPSKPPTRNPSTNPTKGPTLSPTGCNGPPPDVTRPTCKATGTSCNGNNAGNVVMDFAPLITVNPATKSTTFCFTFEVALSSNPICVPVGGNTTIQGVSFIMDECCPINGNMQFLERIDFGNPGTTTFKQYNVRNGECPLITSPSMASMNAAFASTGCSRGERSCTGAGTSPNQQCAVVNMNNIGLAEPQGHFCITVPGTNWNTLNPEKIDTGKTELGKICFESGPMSYNPPGAVTGSPAPTPMDNICSCFEVEIPKSELLCQKTSYPTKSPTPFKCDAELPEFPPVPKKCSYPCQEEEISEWTPYLYKSEYVMQYDLTYFKYCVDTDEEWYEKDNACISRAQTPVRGGWWWKKKQKKPEAFDVKGLSIRLDQCCELCLVKDHFYGETADEYEIVNVEKSSSFWRIQTEPEYHKCYIIEVNGKVGTKPGFVCVEGGNKCMCTQAPVPYSCDLKKVRDALCHEKEEEEEEKDDNGGNSGGNRGGNQWGG